MSEDKKNLEFKETVNADFDWEKEVGFEFDWDEKKVWALEEPTTEINIKELLWHFDVPFWNKDGTEGWNVTPWDVIHGKEQSADHQRRVKNADLSHPIDVMENHGKWLALDGLHRLAKAYEQRQEKVKVRIIPRERIPEILK